jgi:hypothetical protein
VDDSIYSQAGSDQNTKLSFLNSQSCTFTFAAGAIDLSTDATHGTVGSYNPGVYCITGAASIGTSGMILRGDGLFIFRIDGALTTVAGSVVSVTNTNTICNIWWTPIAATTLGANSIFYGNIIDNAGITVGHLDRIFGRLLSFDGTITTDDDVIIVPSC